ncbi:MAG: hypothetical protein DF168_01051 [Candidatus Moanabacter tarae]|uniref:DUF58 domain-containing protein n=1 Tax=Candidatus Moanibacter tarae TaxID=2200854 RepID=A0A2Z4AHS5_9BACT|nr:MAG: hypothetical protein DF168_01051 [Candidatus Moanabacter tarae]|tara:strand:- start:106667 stop:107599 length:933 start_codon:yes stop_codon:yes gene_type:complete
MPESVEVTREILRKVRQVEIRSRRFVTETMGGAYQSVFKGQGMDLEDVREYATGDDIRDIDWNITAKMDKPFVKKYREERELTIMLCVDLSASGNFGSTDQSKRDIAAELASVLAFSATRNNDKVGLLLFTDKIEKVILPKKGRQNVLRVIREVLFFEPTNSGTNIVLALNTLNKILRRKSILFLLSDFLTEDSLSWIRPSIATNGDLFKTVTLTNKRHDLICVEISDPREFELPNVGIINLEDAESGETVEVDTGNSEYRLLYKQQNQRRLVSLKRGLRQSGVDHLSVSTDRHYIAVLREFFRLRERRK